MHRTKTPLLLLGLLPLLAACATPDAGTQPDAGSQTPAETAPHGYIAGAQENSEPQTGLLTLDRETGEAQLLSLLTEETVDAGTFGPVSTVHQDGRYTFITTDDGMDVFDTGAWTVAHGDHDHYYSAEPGVVGTLELEDPGAVAGNGSVIAVFSDSEGYASLYLREDLDAGRIVETGRITTSPHRGVAVPFEDFFLVSVAGADGIPDGVEVRNLDDQTVLPKARCPGLSAHAQTRAGVVFSCTDGALLITEDDGAFAAEHIPYPADASAEPADTLNHRPGSNELAGPAGDTGVWHLDVSERVWTFLETPVPVVAASAVGGDTQRVLAVSTDGSLLSLNPESGAVLNQVPLLEHVEDSVPQLRIDTSRAYVSDPNGSTVYEIDYADGLRVARSFDVPSADFLLETGL
ncbi:lipoprotein [Arthrobacter tumbae]|uniref:hypothetical protein n=1 Tax=Arthrobacter tumbae TaxID=163874 RepID=UPI00195E381F|nr:hypothetical protein [Arthrobacter tumbae]MBM7782193.1 hypothetical protein [Arthrobacter tumbae]